MFDKLKGLLRRKKDDEYNNHGGITGFLPAFDDIEHFKKEYNIKCSAKTVKGLIQCLEKAPDQKWYVFKSLRKKGAPLNVGTFDDFPTLDQALGWLELYGGGRYYVKPMSLGKCKIGYYEFEGEDKIPEDDEPRSTKKTNKILEKWKPGNLKEAILIERAKEGDEKAIKRLTGDEDKDSSQEEIGSLYQKIETLQEQVEDYKEELKDAKDKIDDLKDKLHEKDMEVLKERFSAGGQQSGWGEFAKFLNTDAGKDIAKEGMETFRELMVDGSGEGEERGDEDEKFEEKDRGRKALPPGKDKENKEKPKKDWSPLILLLKYIEANGDPNAYIETLSVQYPAHAFSQWLITVETTEQFLEKFKSAEPKLPLMFSEQGRAWLDELFETLKQMNVKSEKTDKTDAGASEPAHTDAGTKEGSDENKTETETETEKGD